LGNLYANFDVISSIWILEGYVINETPVRIGTGEAEALGRVDNPVLTMTIQGVRKPVIPGSSWKGVLRSEAERFVNSTQDLGKEKGWDNWRACDILIVAGNEKEREKEEENPCIVCSLFGNTGMASHLRVFDSIPVEGTYSLETISRVAIERITGGQSPGKLFRVQLVSPKAVWSFRMELINVDLLKEEGEDPTSFLARYLIRRLIEGVQIGGGKSIGYGLMKLRKEDLKLKVLRPIKGKIEITEKPVESLLVMKSV